MNTTEKNNLDAKEWRSTSYSLLQRAALQHVPLNGTFELTARCNLSCKMCYVRCNPGDSILCAREKTAAEWIDMARQAFEAGTLYLLLTGGEPLLRPDFPEIYAALAQMGFLITLYTNATLVDDRIERLFAKYPPTAVGVTLYGASADTYEAVCGSGAGFQKTLDGLERLRRLRLNLEIRTTFIRDNKQDMQALYALASRYTGNYKINLDLFESFGHVGTDVSSCRMGPAETLDFLDAYLSFFKSRNAHPEHPAATIQALPPNPGGIQPEILTCLAGKSSYAISWDGRLVACSLFTEPCTYPFEEGFAAAWNRLPALFGGIQKPAECLDCAVGQIGACPNCPPKLFLESGDFSKSSPWLCAYAKERHKRAVRRRAEKDEFIE